MAKAILYLEGKSKEYQAIVHLSRLVLDAQGVALKQGSRWGLCDEIDNSGQPYQSAWAAEWMQYALNVISEVDGLPDISWLNDAAAE